MKTPRPLLAIIASSCLAAAARSAQTCISFPDASVTKGVSSNVPFGEKDRNDKVKANQFLQFIVPGSSFGTSPVSIRSIGFVPMSDRDHYFGQFTVTLQHTKLSKPTVNLSANGSGRKSSTRYGAVDWMVTGTAWNRLPADFLFEPALGNLLVSIFILKGESQGLGDPGFLSDGAIDSVYVSGFASGTGNTGTLRMGAPKIQFCVDAPIVVTFGGSGCKGSNGKIPQLRVAGVPSLGKSFDLRLEDALLGNGLAVLVWSWRSLGWQLPGGCTLRPTPDLVNGLATIGGKANLSLQVPNDASLLNGGPLIFQYYAYDPTASALGFAGSNWAEIQVGR